MVESDRPQMKIWRMRILFWVPKAIDTHMQSVIIINAFSNLTTVKQKDLNVTSHVHLIWLNINRGITAVTVGFQVSFIVHLIASIPL